MCGIVGIIGLKQKVLNKENIINMADEIIHRGPDGEGYLFTNAHELCDSIKTSRNQAIIISKNHQQQVAFGHRRLSILDLNLSAAQPMSDISERYWIIYNGEIFNHAELRKQLEDLGHTFKTDHSDTEVILNAYAQWGVECLSRFNGMWAFCIWDTLDNTFFIARDNTGKKPLYYVEINSVLYFSSELKALLKNKEIPKVLNEKAVYDYLTYAMVPSPDTIFKGIKKMPAAHYLFFKPGEELKIKRYWSPFRQEKYLEDSEQEIVESLREKISEAVRIRLRADVDVGILLSGGLDSSINMAYASQFNSNPTKTFCVGFENKNNYVNEFEHARKVASLFKAEYYELSLSEKDYFDFIPDMVYYLDEPTADPANIPLYFISKLARENGTKVLLGGEGSDELFVGYKLWSIARDFETIMKNKPYLSAIAGFLHRNSPVRNKRQYYHPWYEKIQRGQPVFWGGTEQKSEREKRKIFSKDFLNDLQNHSSFLSIAEFYSIFNENKYKDAFDWMSSTDLAYRLPDLLLSRLDKMTMAASVEGRSPFLDVNLINYVMRIPPHLKIKNKQEKYILKKSFEGILPREIIYRKKDSFSIPLDNIFANKENRNISLEVIQNFNNDTSIFTPEYLASLRNNANGNELFTITSLAYWHEKFK